MLHLICGEVLIVVCMCVITVLSYVHFTFVGVNLDSALGQVVEPERRRRNVPEKK